MDATSSPKPSAHVARQLSELRTIVVTTRSGLREVAPDPRKTAWVRARAYRLLMEFEQRVLQGGRDPEVVAAIGAARTALSG